VIIHNPILMPILATIRVSVDRHLQEYETRDRRRRIHIRVRVLDQEPPPETMSHPNMDMNMNEPIIITIPTIATIVTINRPPQEYETIEINSRRRVRVLRVGQELPLGTMSLRMKE